MKKILLPVLLLVAGLILIVSSFFKNSNNGEVAIEIVKANLIMPAVHKVYADPNALNGEYYLFKARITNEGNSTLENVTVNYEVPGYIEWTELVTVGKMLPGQSAVVACYPKFDPDITQKTTASVEQVNVEVDWAGANDEDALEESFSFKMLNRNDYAYTNIPQDEISGWADIFDNNELIACFVTPNDPVVKYYTQIVQEKVMKGESASVTRDPKEGVKFMLGLYNATLLSHMVYSGTKGIPQTLDDLQTMVQHIRLPREVITGNTGLCIELSTLYASVMSAAGLDPVIFLVPGHAYPGFRMNGQYYAIEATGIGGEGLGGIQDAETAFKTGMKQLEQFMKAAQMGDPRYSVVDVHQMNSLGVASMSLEDNDYMRQKVDKIAESFTAQSPSNNGNLTYTPNNNGGGSSRGNRFPGPLSFTIPNGWQTYSYPAPQVPVLTAQVASPDQLANVSVYDIQAASPQQAMQTVSQYLNYMGSQVQYNLQGNSIQGVTTGQGYVFNWKGKVGRTSSGYRIVAVGADSRMYNQYAASINSVYNSIK